MHYGILCDCNWKDCIMLNLGVHLRIFAIRNKMSQNKTYLLTYCKVEVESFSIKFWIRKYLLYVSLLVRCYKWKSALHTGSSLYYKLQSARSELHCSCDILVIMQWLVNRQKIGDRQWTTQEWTLFVTTTPHQPIWTDGHNVIIMIEFPNHATVTT